MFWCLPAAPAESKFSSSGREDVDVRMLGPGRPFVLEVFGLVWHVRAVRRLVNTGGRNEMDK